MTRILAETEQLVHNLDSHVMRNPEIHDSRSSPGVRPVSQDESSLKGNKSAASQKNATKNASSGGRELPQVDALLGSDDLEELLDVANTRVRATEGLAGKPLDEEEVIWIVDDVLVSRRKTEWCKIGGCTTDLQLSLANANSFRKLVVLMTTLLLQRKNRVAGGNDETGVSTLDSAKREPEAPRIASRHVLSVVPYTSENTVAKDTCAQASASSLDCSLTPSDEHAADDPLCDKENVDPVHGVEYTMEELNIVLSKAIAAHKHVDDGSTDSTPPSSPDVSFEDNYLSIDMIFEKFLELLPPGLGLDTSDLIESLPDDEQQYESFADTSTLIDAETTFDTKDGDTIEDTAQDNDVGAYAEMLSSLFSDANKLKEASLAAVAAAETSLLGPLFGHDNPVTSMFSSGEATGACDARQPSNYGLNCDDLQCETWDAQLTENIPIPDVRRIPRDFADEAARRWNFVEGCHGSESRTPNIPSCSLTGMTDQFPNLLCNLDSYKSCDEQNERGGNPDSLVLDPSTHRNGTAVKEPTGPSTVPQTVGLRTGALRNQMNAPAQDDEIIRQGRHSVRVVPYQSGDVEEQQPFDECNAGLACSNSNAKQSCRGPEGSPADDIQDKKSSRNGSTPKVKNTRYGLHQATTPQESSDGSDFGPLLADPVEEEAGAQEYWTSFSNSPFDEFLNAPLRTQPHERVNDFNPFPSQRQSIARSGVGKNTHTSNRQVKTSIHSGKHLHGLTSSRSTPEEKNSASTSKITSSQIGSEPWRSHRFFKPQQRTRSTTKAPHLGSDQVDNSDARRDGKHPKENTTVDLRPSQHDPVGKSKSMSLAGSKKQRSRALRSHGKVSSVSTGLKNAVGQQSAAATYSPNIPWEFFHDNSPAPTDAPLFLSTPTSSSPPAFADGHALRKRRGRNKKIIQGGEQSSPSSVGDFSKNIEDGYSF